MMLEIEEIVEDIKTHTKTAKDALDQDPVDSFTLSQEHPTLAMLNQRLSTAVTQAGYNERAAENFYKRVMENEKVRLVKEDGLAAGVADSMKVEHAKDAFDMWNEAKYYYELGSKLRASTDRTIESLRSKVSYEKTAEIRGV